MFCDLLKTVKSKLCKKKNSIGTGFELTIRESRIADRLPLFEYHFKKFFVKSANQNFHSVTVFVFKETTKFSLHFKLAQFLRNFF